MLTRRVKKDPDSLMGRRLVSLSHNIRLGKIEAYASDLIIDNWREGTYLATSSSNIAEVYPRIFGAVPGATSPHAVTISGIENGSQNKTHILHGKATLHPRKLCDILACALQIRDTNSDAQWFYSKTWLTQMRYCLPHPKDQC